MGTIIQESVALQYERLIPIKVRQIALIKGMTEMTSRGISP
jgi:hypothetical protein